MTAASTRSDAARGELAGDALGQPAHRQVRGLMGKLASTSKRRSPAIASITVTAIVALYCLAFVIYDPSNRRGAAQARHLVAAARCTGILAVQALVSIAIIRYFLTSARADFHWWTTCAAPLIGFAAMVTACALLIINRDGLAGATGVLYIEALPWVILVVFVIGMIAAAVLRSRAPDKYAGIGQFEIAEITEPVGGQA